MLNVLCQLLFNLCRVFDVLCPLNDERFIFYVDYSWWFVVLLCISSFVLTTLSSLFCISSFVLTALSCLLCISSFVLTTLCCLLCISSFVLTTLSCLLCASSSVQVAFSVTNLQNQEVNFKASVYSEIIYLSRERLLHHLYTDTPNAHNNNNTNTFRLGVSLFEIK